MSAILHAAVDALGYTTRFHLISGLTHDLTGVDELFSILEEDILMADKLYDAAEKAIDILSNAGKQSVIPYKWNRHEPEVYNRELYMSRQLIQFFFLQAQTVPSDHK